MSEFKDRDGLGQSLEALGIQAAAWIWEPAGFTLTQADSDLLLEHQCGWYSVIEDRMTPLADLVTAAKSHEKCPPQVDG